MRKALAITAALLFGASVATIATTALAEDAPYCPQEDSCIADYRDGAWHITPDNSVTYWVTVPACEDAPMSTACVYFDEGVFTWYPRGEFGVGEPVATADVIVRDSGAIDVNIGKVAR